MAEEEASLTYGGRSYFINAGQLYERETGRSYTFYEDRATSILTFTASISHVNCTHTGREQRQHAEGVAESLPVKDVNVSFKTK